MVTCLEIVRDIERPFGMPKCIHGRGYNVIVNGEKLSEQIGIIEHKCYEIDPNTKQRISGDLNAVVGFIWIKKIRKNVRFFEVTRERSPDENDLNQVLEKFKKYFQEDYPE